MTNPAEATELSAAQAVAATTAALPAKKWRRSSRFALVMVGTLNQKILLQMGRKLYRLFLLSVCIIDI